MYFLIIQRIHSRSDSRQEQTLLCTGHGHIKETKLLMQILHDHQMVDRPLPDPFYRQPVFSADLPDPIRCKAIVRADGDHVLIRFPIELPSQPGHKYHRILQSLTAVDRTDTDAVRCFRETSPAGKLFFMDPAFFDILQKSKKSMVSGLLKCLCLKKELRQIVQPALSPGHTRRRLTEPCLFQDAVQKLGDRQIDAFLLPVFDPGMEPFYTVNDERNNLQHNNNYYNMQL